VIKMDDVSHPIYWLGTQTPMASFMQLQSHYSWKWETNIETVDEIMGQCYLKPQELIAVLKDGMELTGFQLKNLFYSCRIVRQ